MATRVVLGAMEKADGLGMSTVNSHSKETLIKSLDRFKIKHGIVDLGRGGNECNKWLTDNTALKVEFVI